MAWTYSRVARLKKLWAEGVPTIKIGRRLGTTKNAIIGKADRLNLAEHVSFNKRFSTQEWAVRLLRMDTMRRRGVTAKNIGRTLGISGRTVQFYAAEYGLTKTFNASCFNGNRPNQ